MLFTEDFLHYVWKFRLFDRQDLRTTEGEELEIYSVGLHNTHAGPDFHNARIRIGETTWAGNAELHLSSSDWQRHGHTTDGAYDNVILHVVYTDDQPVTLPGGRRVHTLELKNRINPDLYLRYHNLVFGNQTIIPCEASIGKVDPLTMQNWLTRVLVERLEKRTEAVTAALAINRGDWEGMDAFFNTDTMTYDNPNRPDLGTYSVWKTSPQGLYKTFPPSIYRTLKAWGRGEDEICVLCHHHGKHIGGPYMGVQPTGNELNVLWFSGLRFRDGKIDHIYSISDVLSMLKDLEVIEVPQPVDPYK